jgi:probable rRNA maturation factor
MGVLIQNQQRIQRIDLREIRRRAQTILKILGITEKELSILLADDPTIAELNHRYLQRAKPTNVIAFPMQEGPCSKINPHILGDVVISVETAKRQARQAGLPTFAVLERLLVHGVLHLVGYDHEATTREARQMERKEQEILQALRTKSTSSKPGKPRKRGGVIC